MTEKKFKACGKWVFIRRNEQEKAHNGTLISDKAQIKNMTGTMTHYAGSVNVSVGDKIHVPHFMVKDIEFDGVEYAVAQEGNLFAKEKDGVFIPINKYIKIRKCENDHVRNDDGEIVLYQTENFIEETNWVEIIDVSEDCDYFTREDIGSFCIAPEVSDKLQRVLYTKDFMLHESMVEFTTGD